LAWFFFSRLMAAVVTLVVFLVLTRVLGPADFGRYNLTVLTGTIAFSVVFAWLSAAIVRFHNAPEFEGRALAKALGAFLRLGLAASLVVALAALAAPADRAAAILLAALFCGAHALHEIGLSGLRVYNQGPLFAAVTLARPVLGVALALLLVYGGGGYGSAVIGMSVGAALMGLYGLFRVSRRSGIATPDMPTLRAFFAFGGPLAAVASVSMLMMLISQSFLAWLVDLETVGIYAAAQTLAMRSISMPMLMASRAWEATVFKTHEEHGNEAADRVLARQFSFLLLVALPVVVTMCAANDTVASIFFDQSFRADVARHLPFLAIASFLAGLQGGYFALPFMIGRKTLIQLIVTAGVTAAHGIISVALILGFGGIGASLAFLVSMVLAIGFYILVGRSIRPVRAPWREVRAGLAAAGVMLPFALAADHAGSLAAALVLLAAGSVTFLAALLLLRQDAAMRVVRRLSSRLIGSR
jgi:O-antigen/teichoic acid export membrane protein